ncbi:MAG: hypothetical protein AAF481_17770 [Acidobacteriota bacterium]
MNESSSESEPLPVAAPAPAGRPDPAAESAVATLRRRLREADEEGLLRLIRETPDDRFDAVAARQALRNPFAGSAVTEWVLGRPALKAVYEVRRDLAFHPATPQARALDLVPGLYWRDLVALGAEMRVHPALRRAADRNLIRRFAGLSLGEKTAIARRAGGTLLAHARNDKNPRVMAAVLENPRLTEGLLTPLLRRDDAEPAVLETIAGSRRWGSRYAVRRALSRNRRTPDPVALRLLPQLKKNDQRAVASDPKLSPVVRRRARLLLGEHP